MTRLLISTVRRHAPATEPSGYFYTFDTDQDQIIQRSLMIEPAHREADTNPGGGIRGSRGIAIRSDQAVISNASAIFRFDPDWNLLGTISHPVCASIHDVLFEKDTLWVTSARTDMIFQFDLAGNLLQYYYLRQPSPARKAISWNPPLLLNAELIRSGRIDFRNPATHDEDTYDRAHVNSICLLPGGDLLVSLGLVSGGQYALLLRLKNRLLKLGVWPALLAVNRQVRSLLGLSKKIDSDLVIQPAAGKSAVFKISPDGMHRLVFMLANSTVPAHSLLLLPDQTLIYLNTTTGSVLNYALDTGEIIYSVKVTDGFLRGAYQMDERTLIFGSKRELLFFDLQNRQVTSTRTIADDPNEAVYTIQPLPDHYALPPAAFVT